MEHNKKTLMTIFLKKKGGFTLVELMIVIFIIAVLSTLAVNGYVQYRRSALLDFAADNFVSQLYALKDKAVHGAYGESEYEAITNAILEGSALPQGNDEPKCFGVKFFEPDDLNLLGAEKFEIGFDSKKGLENEVMVQIGCPQSTVGVDTYISSSFELDSLVKVEGVYDDSRAELSGLSIMFVPPDGELKVYDNVGEYSGTFVEVVFQYGESIEDRYKKSIFIDSKSGKAEVKPR